MSAPDPSSTTAGAAEIIYNLGVCLRICASYELSNANVAAPIEKLVSSVNRASRDGGTLSIQAVHDKFFLNKRFVRLDAAAYDQSRPLLQIFKRLNINEIAFHVERLEVRQLRQFLEAYKRYLPTSRPSDLAGEVFEAVAVRTIDGTEADAFDRQSTPKDAILRQYCLLMIYLARVTLALRTGQPTRLAGLRRMLQKLSDLSEGYEPLLVAIGGLPQIAAKPQAHQVRCAAMALLMGRRLGFSRAALIDVALAALFHDIAREDDAPEPQSPAPQGDAVRKVSLQSLVQMCRSGVGLDTHLRLAVAREVWAPLKGTPAPSLAARWIAVPCAFDLLTRTTPARRGLTPEHAMRILVSRVDSRYDSRALKAFAAAIGVYPAGSVLDLTDGSVALVTNGAAGSALLQLVRRAPSQGDATASGRPGANVGIAGCADAAERGVNAAHYFLS